MRWRCYWLELDELPPPLGLLLELDSGLAFLCFLACFLVVLPVLPEAPEVFTPDVSVALGLELLVPLLLPPAEEPDIPEPPPEEPEVPEVPEEPEDPDIAPEEPLLLPEEAPVSLCDPIGEDWLLDPLDPLEPEAPVCASAIEDTDATNTNDNDRIVVLKVMSHSFRLKEKHHRCRSLESTLVRAFSTVKGNPG